MPLVPPSPLTLTAADLAYLPEDLEAYHARYAPLFPRREQAASARRYLCGLFADAPRKSVERMVLKIRGPDRNAVRALQQFVSASPWPDAPILARHWEEVGGTLGTPDGVLIVDGSDFPKQGQESVGVARPYCGERGKTDNCQAGVFLAYSSAKGTILVHRALYLPQHWVEDPAWAARRQRGRIPPDPPFRTQPQLALDLLQEVVAAGTLPARWVTCDEAYGQVPAFLDPVAAWGLGYCAEVPHSTRVWPDPHPPAGTRGRPVRAVAADLPADRWQRLTFQEGSQGPLQAEFTALRVAASRQARPGPTVWLLLRRHPVTRVLKTYLCHAPADMALTGAGGPGRLALAHRDLLPGRQAALGAGRLRGPQLGRLAPPHDPLLSGPLLPGAPEVAPAKKAPRLTVRQVAALLQALLRRPRRDGAWRPGLLAYRALCNEAAARSHRRRRSRGDPGLPGGHRRSPVPTAWTQAGIGTRPGQSALPDGTGLGDVTTVIPKHPGNPCRVTDIVGQEQGTGQRCAIPLYWLTCPHCVRVVLLPYARHGEV